MRQKVKFNLTCLFILFIQVFFAQVTITIPSTNTSIGTIINTEARKPLGTYFGYERTAVLLKHSEIGYYGQIVSVAVYCDSVSNPGKVPLAIYMKEVSDSAFYSATTISTEEIGTTLVYADTIAASAFVQNQWVTINFSTPFAHTTSRPIELIFETNASGTGNENNPLRKRFRHSSVALNNCQYWQGDNAAPIATGTLTVNRPNIQLNVIPVLPCSGIPVAGVTQSTTDTVCAGQGFILSLQGATVATGLTYQWQDSIATGSWISIPFADSLTLLTSDTATLFYRCAVTCTGQTSYSSVKEIILRNYLKCYCTTNLGGGCSGTNTAIDSVAIEGTTLANGLTGCSANNYKQYPASGNTTATLVFGQSYNLHTRYNGNVISSLWIDYNQNGAFEISEWQQICLLDTSANGMDSDIVTVINVPATAKIGLTLMRIRTRSSGNTNDSISSCINFGSGETEDYFVNISYPTGIKNINKTNFNINLFPNPANSLVMLEGNFNLNEKVHTNLYNINGALINETENQYAGKPIQIDVSGIDTGIYFLKIATTDFSSTKKIIISR